MRKKRNGVAMVEFAIVAPLTFMMIIGLMIGGLGVFRYQECAYLAKQAARYASVHGSQYALDTGNSPATSQSIYDNVIKPNLFILDPNSLSYTVTWNTDNGQYHTIIQNNQNVFINNSVTVAITYKWSAQPFIATIITMQSSSTTPMSY